MLSLVGCVFQCAEGSACAHSRCLLPLSAAQFAAAVIPDLCWRVYSAGFRGATAATAAMVAQLPVTLGMIAANAIEYLNKADISGADSLVLTVLC